MLELFVHGGGRAGGAPHRPQREDNAYAGGNPGGRRDHGGNRYGDRSLPRLLAATLRGRYTRRKVKGVVFYGVGR